MIDKKNINVAIVDDHALFCEGLRALIDRYDQAKKYRIIFEARNGKEMMKEIGAGKVPDILLLDISMPLMNGFDSVQWLHEHHPAIKIIVMSMSEDAETVVRMLKMKVSGYLSKGSNIGDLKNALEAVTQSGFYHSEFISSKMLESLAQGAEKHSDILSQLTENEMTFLKWTSTELTYAEIARKMKLSPKTIDSYRDSLFKKLEVTSRVGLVIFAIKHGVTVVNKHSDIN